MKHTTILLSYSGGLDTSAIIPWLKQTYDCSVIAYCSNLGNAPDENLIGQKAIELGADEFIFEDLQQTFCENFVWPMLQAGATYQNSYLLGTAIARPLIAERIARYAIKYNATGIAHGATGKGNDQLRFERAWAALIPEVQVIAPWKLWHFKGRHELIQYLAKNNFTYVDQEKEFSVDVNLLHRSCEGGILEDISRSYDPQKVYQWTTPPELVSSNNITDIQLGFNKGRLKSINGTLMSEFDLLTTLNKIAGQHGIGVLDLVEERTNGVKSRGIYETPGGTLIAFALQNLKNMSWDRKTLSVAHYLSQQYGELIYDGLWHSETRKYLSGFFSQACEVLNGEISIKLQGSQMIVTGRSSQFNLYNQDLVSFESDQWDLNQSAQGFCKTMSYSLSQAAQQRKRFESLI